MNPLDSTHLDIWPTEAKLQDRAPLASNNVRGAK